MTDLMATGGIVLDTPVNRDTILGLPPVSDMDLGEKPVPYYSLWERSLVAGAYQISPIVPTDRLVVPAGFWMNDAVHITVDGSNNMVFQDVTGIYLLSDLVGGGGGVQAFGTPVDNQIAIWTNANTIEGDATFTYNGTGLTIGSAGTLGTYERLLIEQEFVQVRLRGTTTSGSSIVQTRLIFGSNYVSDHTILQQNAVACTDYGGAYSFNIINVQTGPATAYVAIGGKNTVDMLFTGTGVKVDHIGEMTTNNQVQIGNSTTITGTLTVTANCNVSGTINANGANGIWTGVTTYSDVDTQSRIYIRSLTPADATWVVRPSASTRFQMYAWDTDDLVSRSNEVETYFSGYTGIVTFGELRWRNVTKNGASNSTQLMSLDQNGKLTVAGTIATTTNFYSSILTGVQLLLNGNSSAYGGIRSEATDTWVLAYGADTTIANASLKWNSSGIKVDHIGEITGSHGTYFDNILYVYDAFHYWNGSSGVLRNGNTVITGGVTNYLSFSSVAYIQTTGAVNLTLGTNNGSHITINSTGGILFPSIATKTTETKVLWINDSTGQIVKGDPSGVATPVDSTLLDWSTDRYQPYASSAGGGSLYSGTSWPTSTTRLNYDGYFFATYLYAGAATTDYFLAAGNQLKLVASSTDRLIFTPSIADSGSVTAYILDTQNALTLGRNLLSIRNNGSEKLYVTYDGSLVSSQSITAGWVVYSDTFWNRSSNMIISTSNGNPAANISIYPGDGASGNASGGSLYLRRGLKYSGGAGVNGSIYIGTGAVCHLDADDTETSLVAIDSTTGLLSRRTVASLPGGGSDTTNVTWVLAAGEAATVGTNKTNVIVIPRAGTIVKVFAYAKTAPTGAALIFDINKNGTSIWNTTPANRIQIAAGANSGTQTSFDTTSLAEGDTITIDIDQIGSTVAGQDITITLKFS